MIIPTISATRFRTGAAGFELPKLIDSIRCWSLFGKMTLTDADAFGLDQLELMLKQVGGSVDIQIKLDSPEEAAVLALLNAGASTIICKESEAAALQSVPPDRLAQLHNNHKKTLTAGDQIEQANPTAKELSNLEKIGVDCLVNADLLRDNPDLIADFFCHTLVSDRPDGLWPTLIVDSLGLALGLAYSNRESLLDAVVHRRGTYWSRSRDSLWIKGASSGAIQQLIGIRMDCDRDCLRFQVGQEPPGFCHRETYSCFGEQRTIQSVVQRLCERIESTDEQSFTKTLANDPEMLRKKLLEEALELSDSETASDITWEAADVLYFSLVKMLGQGVKLEQVYEELARRMNRVVRRKNKLLEDAD